MVKAIMMARYGGPEVLKWVSFEPGSPAAGAVRIKQMAIGLNFIDVYHRTGLYPLAALPAIPGLEGAGIVEEVGPDVTEFRPGDRVAYAGVPPGAYAQERCIPADRLVLLPDDISFQDGAAMMLQGMTARYLLKGCFAVKPGAILLIHAAAGGVGLILCQWAKHLGALTIGTVGSPAKAELAKAHGCSHTVLYQEEDFEQAVKEFTRGRGVDAVYDSVGQATFGQSLDCLAPMGTMVSFGQSSGPVPPFDIGLLAAKGSLFLTRPSLMNYTAKREDLLSHARDLFEVVGAGAVNIAPRQEYRLQDAAQAHLDLENRTTTGSTILIP